jgi:hypothetical protein
MAYVVPQALIYQEFSILPTALTDPLRACIIGPHYALNRYSDEDEKPNIKVTNSYDPDTDEVFSWPNRTAGAVVDTDYTSVYFDDALLQYYQDPGGDASGIYAVEGYRNRIRFGSLVLQTKNGYNRTSVFCDRDVAPGDVLDIIASACGEPVSLRTQILDFIPDPIPAVIGDAESDPSNKHSQSQGGDYNQTAGDENNVCIESIDVSSFDGRDDGLIEETYTIEVVSSGNGGDAETALLKVTAASGTEGPFTITPEAFGSPTEIGGRGLTVTFNNDGCGSSSSPGVGIDPNDFIAGQTWVVEAQQTYDAPVAASGGLYLGSADTTYIVEVVDGGDFGTARIQATTSTGVDQSAPTVVSALNTPVAIGSQGLTIKFTSAANGLCKGDRFTIEVEAEKDGAVRTVVLSNPLPYEMRGMCNFGDESSSSSEAPPDLAVTFYIKKDIEVPEDREGFAPLVNWEQSDTQITLKSGVIAYDSSWTCSGVLQALPVKDGIVYVEHRDLLTDLCGEVNSISDVSEINTDNFGAGAVIDPDNPLVFGVYNALLNSSGTPVKYIGVCASSPIELEDWTEALEVLQDRDDVYSLTPMTQDQQVLQLVQGHIEAMSSPEKGRWRIGWFNLQATTEKGMYTCSEKLGAGSCDPVLATITDDPDAAGTQYTLLTAAGEKFLTSIDQEVEAGDIVRAQYQDDGFGNVTYSEYVVDEVLNEEEIRLFTGPSAPINTPSKIEIWRNLSRTEIAQEYATNAGTFNSRRVYLVWPDQVGNAGETFAGYYLCAALAGLRSASLPHRPLTNVEILGFDDISRTTEFFNAPQLDTLAAAGIWIVTQDPNDGDVYTRHQLSTDNLDLNRKEQSVTTNVDSISYTFLRRLAVYIGRGNVTPTMINIIRGEILSVLDFFSSFVVQDILGPQVISYEIDQLEQHPVLRDRVLAVVNLVIPYPLNNIELHLVI